MSTNQTTVDVFSEIVADRYPSPEKVVSALLRAEKNARKQKTSYRFTDLEGTWKLRFITGTKKTRHRAGVVLGAGKYLPKLANITITYQATGENIGTVTNRVDLKLLQLVVGGPVKFLPHRNILGFDFSQTKIDLGTVNLYDTKETTEHQKTEFYQSSIAKQAFFVYFLVRPNLIAARGKGGGLAIWTRV